MSLLLILFPAVFVEVKLQTDTAGKEKESTNKFDDGQPNSTLYKEWFLETIIKIVCYFFSNNYVSYVSTELLSP